MLVFFQQLAIDFLDISELNLLSSKKIRVAGLSDINFAQHLAYDHLDMLVVDLYALQTINVLDFLNQVSSQCLDTQQTQDVLGIWLAIGDYFATLNLLTFEHIDISPLRNQFLMTLFVRAGDDQSLLALGFLTKTDGTGTLCEDSRLFWLTRFEQVGYAR